MNNPNKYLRYAFFILIRIVLTVVLGLNVRRKELLPKNGPAIIVANHNSHLDTLVLVSLFPMRLLEKVRPVAAADYFLKNKIIGWFALNVIGIVPIVRGGGSKSKDPLAPCYDALGRGDIIILFPEGTRGEPEKLSEFKKGIAHLAQKYPNVLTTPVYMHGLGKALPKGAFLPVPFFCDIFVGNGVSCEFDRGRFMDKVRDEFQLLANEERFYPWE